jgi:HlyD family secretion protein
MKAPSFVSILAVAAITWAIYSVVKSAPHRETTEPPVLPPHSVFESTVAASGLVEPSSESISIGTPRAAVVDAVMVKAGDQVKKDQPLFKLRTRELEAEYTAAEASVKEAQAQVKVAQSQVAVAQAQVSIADSALADAQSMLDFANSVKDSRVLSSEERSTRAMAVATRKAQILAAKASVTAAESSVASAQAAVSAAQARLEVNAVAIDRSTVKAPLDATVLQVKLRAGEFTSSEGGMAFMTLGCTQPLHIRADVDEHEAWRMKASSRAEAQVRGNTALKVPLKFVRFEPLVVPKRSLTGEATERVDTRVLQVIFAIETAPTFPLFVGQQMDVFIDAATEPNTAQR